MVLHLNKLESPIPKEALCKFGWNWPSSFKERILNIFNIILLLRFYLPFESGLALYLNKLESPPPKDALCQVWLKLAQKFWRRRYLDIFNIILHFRYYFPLEKGRALWNWPSCSGEEVENRKSLHTDGRRTTGDQ